MAHELDVSHSWTRWSIILWVEFSLSLVVHLLVPVKNKTNIIYIILHLHSQHTYTPQRNREEKKIIPHQRTLEAERDRFKKNMLITILSSLSDQQHVLNLVLLSVQKNPWRNSGLCHFRLVMELILILGSESSVEHHWHEKLHDFELWDPLVLPSAWACTPSHHSAG